MGLLSNLFSGYQPTKAECDRTLARLYDEIAYYQRDIINARDDKRRKDSARSAIATRRAEIAKVKIQRRNAKE